MKRKEYLKQLLRSTKGTVMTASAGVNKILMKLQPKIPQKYKLSKKKAHLVKPSKSELKIIEMVS